MPTITTLFPSYLTTVPLAATAASGTAVTANATATATATNGWKRSPSQKQSPKHGQKQQQLSRQPTSLSWAAAGASANANADDAATMTRTVFSSVASIIPLQPRQKRLLSRSSLVMVAATAAEASSVSLSLSSFLSLSSQSLSSPLLSQSQSQSQSQSSNGTGSSFHLLQAHLPPPPKATVHGKDRRRDPFLKRTTKSSATDATSFAVRSSTTDRTASVPSTSASSTHQQLGQQPQQQVDLNFLVVEPHVRPLHRQQAVQPADDPAVRASSETEPHDPIQTTPSSEFLPNPTTESAPEIPANASNTTTIITTTATTATSSLKPKPPASKTHASLSVRKARTVKPSTSMQTPPSNGGSATIRRRNFVDGWDTQVDEDYVYWRQQHGLGGGGAYYAEYPTAAMIPSRCSVAASRKNIIATITISHDGAQTTRMDRAIPSALLHSTSTIAMVSQGRRLPPRNTTTAATTTTTKTITVKSQPPPAMLPMKDRRSARYQYNRQSSTSSSALTLQAGQEEDGGGEEEEEE